MKSLSFDALRDLAQILNKNKIKQLEVLGVTQFAESKTEALYEGLLRGKFKSDDDAAKELYDSFSKDPKYKKIRAKFFRQLVNTVFFIDNTEAMFTEQTKAISNCYRDFAAAQMVKGRGAKEAAAFLLQQTLTQAEKFELTSLCSEIARSIVGNFGNAINDNNAFQRYSELFEIYEKKRLAEMDAFSCFRQLDEYYNSANSPNEKVFEMADEFYNRLKPQADEVDTIEFRYRLFLIGMIRNSARGEYQESLTLVDETLEKLGDRPGLTRGQHQAILLQKLFCISQLRLPAEDDHKALLDKYYELCRDGDYSWFKGHEVMCYYFIATQQYDKALDEFQLIIQQSNYERLSGMTHDNMHLLLGYLNLLGELGALDAKKLDKLNSGAEFRLSKHMNEFQVAEKDREGMNIPIMLLPLLYSILEKVPESATKSTDALDKYRQRYLESELNKRSACFLKLLLALLNYPYQVENAERKIKKELDNLSNLPPDINKQVYFVEVVPYEHLWEMMYEKVKGG